MGGVRVFEHENDNSFCLIHQIDRIISTRSFAADRSDLLTVCDFLGSFEYLQQQISQHSGEEQLLSQLVPLCRFVRFRANTPIIRKGDRSDNVYVLASGTVGEWVNKTKEELEFENHLRRSITQISDAIQSLLREDFNLESISTMSNEVRQLYAQYTSFERQLSLLTHNDNLIGNLQEYFEKPQNSSGQVATFHGLNNSPLGMSAVIKMKGTLIGRQDVFGYMNILQGSRPKTTLISSTECVCLSFTGLSFFNVCSVETENPKYVQDLLISHFEAVDPSVLEVIAAELSSAFLHANQPVLTLKGGGNNALLAPTDTLLFIVKSGEITVREDYTSMNLCKFSAGSIFGQEQLIAGKSMLGKMKYTFVCTSSRAHLLTITKRSVDDSIISANNAADGQVFAKMLENFARLRVNFFIEQEETIKQNVLKFKRSKNKKNQVANKSKPISSATGAVLVATSALSPTDNHASTSVLVKDTNEQDFLSMMSKTSLKQTQTNTNTTIALNPDINLSDINFNQALPADASRLQPQPQQKKQNCNISMRELVETILSYRPGKKAEKNGEENSATPRKHLASEIILDEGQQSTKADSPEKVTGNQRSSRFSGRPSKNLGSFRSQCSLNLIDTSVRVPNQKSLHQTSPNQMRNNSREFEQQISDLGITSTRIILQSANSSSSNNGKKTEQQSIAGLATTHKRDSLKSKKKVTTFMRNSKEEVAEYEKFYPQKFKLSEREIQQDNLTEKSVYSLYFQSPKQFWQAKSEDQHTTTTTTTTLTSPRKKKSILSYSTSSSPVKTNNHQTYSDSNSPKKVRKLKLKSPNKFLGIHFHEPMQLPPPKRKPGPWDFISQRGEYISSSPAMPCGGEGNGDGDLEQMNTVSESNGNYMKGHPHEFLKKIDERVNEAKRLARLKEQRKEDSQNASMNSKFRGQQIQKVSDALSAINKFQAASDGGSANPTAIDTATANAYNTKEKSRSVTASSLAQTKIDVFTLHMLEDSLSAAAVTPRHETSRPVSGKGQKGFETTLNLRRMSLPSQPSPRSQFSLRSLMSTKQKDSVTAISTVQSLKIKARTTVVSSASLFDMKQQFASYQQKHVRSQSAARASSTSAHEFADKTQLCGNKSPRSRLATSSSASLRFDNITMESISQLRQIRSSSSLSKLLKTKESSSTASSSQAIYLFGDTPTSSKHQRKHSASPSSATRTFLAFPAKQQQHSAFVKTQPSNIL